MKEVAWTQVRAGLCLGMETGHIVLTGPESKWELEDRINEIAWHRGQTQQWKSTEVFPTVETTLGTYEEYNRIQSVLENEHCGFLKGGSGTTTGIQPCSEWTGMATVVVVWAEKDDYGGVHSKNGQDLPVERVWRRGSLGMVLKPWAQVPGKQKSDLTRGTHFKMQWTNSSLSVESEVEAAEWPREAQHGQTTGADPLALERGLVPPSGVIPTHSAQKAQSSLGDWQHLWEVKTESFRTNPQTSIEPSKAIRIEHPDWEDEKPGCVVVETIPQPHQLLPSVS